MKLYLPCCRVVCRLSPSFLICIVVLCGTPLWAQHERNHTSSYTTLSDAAVLKMKLSEFQSRYGKDSVGTNADDLLYFYAAALARTNDRAAIRVSPTVAKEIQALRSRLQTWDAARFTPAAEYVGGSLEAGHLAASHAVEREAMFKVLIPLMNKKAKTRQTSYEEKRARAAFRKWLTESAQDAVPMREQMENLDADERADLRLSYAAWYTDMKTLARGLEDAALKLPSPAATRLLDYARHL